jgi:GAF domain-containing protein
MTGEQENAALIQGALRPEHVVRQGGDVATLEDVIDSKLVPHAPSAPRTGSESAPTTRHHKIALASQLRQAAEQLEVASPKEVLQKDRAAKLRGLLQEFEERHEQKLAALRNEMTAQAAEYERRLEEIEERNAQRYAEFEARYAMAEQRRASKIRAAFLDEDVIEPMNVPKTDEKLIFSKELAAPEPNSSLDHAAPQVKNIEKPEECAPQIVAEETEKCEERDVGAEFADAIQASLSSYDIPPKAPDEEARQARLQSLIHASSDPRIASLIQLAGLIFDLPMCALNLIQDTETFVAACTLPIEVMPRTLPRDVSFCSWTILGDTPQIMAIEDATKDVYLQNHPAVVGPPFLRSYLGCPVVTSDGYRLGALCLCDFQTKVWNAASGQILANFADYIVRVMENAALEGSGMKIDDPAAEVTESSIAQHTGLITTCPLSLDLPTQQQKNRRVPRSLSLA